ncbi:hypothetical protein SDC9_97570 [bioreactor metagenome]|uniref:Recombinase domain-containing protein n=1 Tax=bioreactor metagenome TaxID=1076179 RepID=A0A645ACZ3_9ZZZZ
MRIARILNQEGLPCPSAYKQLQGQRYHNGLRLDATAYWTYATIHRMLSNRMYAGSMEQGRTQRQTLHGKARQLERSQWTVVEGTHEAIVSPAQFERVQTLLEQDTRSPCFDRSVSPFAGFLRCGDCGRAMSKTGRAGAVRYCCGSYKRYGPSACSGHSISQRELEELLLSDLNRMLASAGNLSQLAARALPKGRAAAEDIRQQGHLRSGLERTCRLKKAVYEDYREGLLTREEFLKYREDYQRQETQLAACLARLETREPPAPGHPWAEALVKEGRLAALDRATLAEAVEKILVFADGTVEITYKFAPCAALAPEEALSES